MRLLLDLTERLRWLGTKVGFWIMDFQVLQTQMQVMIAFVGNRRRISVTISTGKKS